MNYTDTRRQLAEQVAEFFWACLGGPREDTPPTNEGDVALADALMPVVRAAVADEVEIIADAVLRASRNAEQPTTYGLAAALRHRANRIREDDGLAKIDSAPSPARRVEAAPDAVPATMDA